MHQFLKLALVSGLLSLAACGQNQTSTARTQQVTRTHPVTRAARAHDPILVHVYKEQEADDSWIYWYIITSNNTTSSTASTNNSTSTQRSEMSSNSVSNCPCYSYSSRTPVTDFKNASFSSTNTSRPAGNGKVTEENEEELEPEQLPEAVEEAVEPVEIVTDEVTETTTEIVSEPSESSSDTSSESSSSDSGSSDSGSSSSD